MKIPSSAPSVVKLHSSSQHTIFVASSNTSSALTATNKVASFAHELASVNSGTQLASRKASPAVKNCNRPRARTAAKLQKRSSLVTITPATAHDPGESESSSRVGTIHKACDATASGQWTAAAPAAAMIGKLTEDWVNLKHFRST